MDKIRATCSAKVSKQSNYACLNHVSATSNVVERLFSRAKLVMTDQRRSMDPSTLEAILLLRYNHDIWDVYFLDSLVQRVNAGFPADETIEELIEPNADGEDDNAEDDYDDAEEGIVMRLMQKSADPLPVLP